jgi:hypothetical protein
MLRQFPECRCAVCRYVECRDAILKEAEISIVLLDFQHQKIRTNTLKFFPVNVFEFWFADPLVLCAWY